MSAKKEMSIMSETFKELRKKEKAGEILRDKGGMEPSELSSIIKMKICKKIREYRRANNLQNKDIAKILSMNDAQVSMLMAIHYEKFSLDFLVNKIEILAKVDPDSKKTEEILKIAC